MLGIGLGVQRGGASPRKKLFTDVNIAQPATDYFRGYSVEGGSITFTADQTIGGASGWLKGQFPGTNQSAPSGITVLNIADTGDVRKGMLFKVEFDIFLETAANWTEGSETTSNIAISFGNTTTNVDLTPDQTVHVTMTPKACDLDAAINTSFNDLILFFNAENQTPEANAKFYIKNFEFRLGNDSTLVTG